MFFSLFFCFYVKKEKVFSKTDVGWHPTNNKMANYTYSVTIEVGIGTKKLNTGAAEVKNQLKQWEKDAQDAINNIENTKVKSMTRQNREHSRFVKDAIKEAEKEASGVIGAYIKQGQARNKIEEDKRREIEKTRKAEVDGLNASFNKQQERYRKDREEAQKQINHLNNLSRNTSQKANKYEDDNLRTENNKRGSFDNLLAFVGIGSAAALGFAFAEAFLEIAVSAISTGLNQAFLAVQESAGFERMRISLAAVVGSSVESGNAIKRLDKIAQDTPGLTFKTALDGYQRLRAVGFQAKETEKALIGLTKVKLLSGSTEDDLQAVLINFAQIRSIGKLTGDELRETLGRMPYFSQVLEKGFGTISTEQIAKYNLSSKEFFEVLIGELGKVPDIAGGAAIAFEDLTDEFYKTQLAFGEPLLQPVTEGLNELTMFLRENKDVFADWGKTTAGVLQSFVESWRIIDALGVDTLFASIAKSAVEVPLNTFVGLDKIKPLIAQFAAVGQANIEAKRIAALNAKPFSIPQGSFNFENNTVNLGYFDNPEAFSKKQAAEMDEEVRRYDQTKKEINKIEENSLRETEAISRRRFLAIANGLRLSGESELNALQQTAKIEKDISDDRLRILQENYEAQIDLTERFLATIPERFRERARKGEYLEIEKQRTELEKSRIEADIAEANRQRQIQELQLRNKTAALEREKQAVLQNLESGFRVQEAQINAFDVKTTEQAKNQFIAQNSLRQSYLQNQIKVQSRHFAAMLNLYSEDAGKVTEISANRNSVLSQLQTEYAVSEINAQKQLAEYEKRLLQERRENRLEENRLLLETIRFGFETQSADVRRILQNDSAEYNKYYDELITISNTSFAEILRITRQNNDLTLQNENLTGEQKNLLRRRFIFEEEKMIRENADRIVEIEKERTNRIVREIENLFDFRAKIFDENSKQSGFVLNLFNPENLSTRAVNEYIDNFNAKLKEFRETLDTIKKDQTNLTFLLKVAEDEGNTADVVKYTEKILEVSELTRRITEEVKQMSGELSVFNRGLAYLDFAKLDGTAGNDDYIDGLRKILLLEGQRLEFQKLLNEEERLNEIGRNSPARFNEIQRELKLVEKRKETLTRGQADELAAFDRSTFASLKQDLLDLQTGDFDTLEVLYDNSRKKNMREVIGLTQQLILLGREDYQNAQIQKALLEKTTEIRSRDLNARIAGEKALLEIQANSQYSETQANAKMLEFLASQKSVTDTLADARISLISESYNQLDKVLDRLTKRMGIFGGVLKDVLSNLIKLALNRVFLKILGLDPSGSSKSGGGGIFGGLGGFGNGGGLGSVTGGGSNGNRSAIQAIQSAIQNGSANVSQQIAPAILGGNGSVRPRIVLNAPVTSNKGLSGFNLKSIQGLIGDLAPTLGASFGGLAGGASGSGAGSLIGSGGGLVAGSVLSALLAGKLTGAATGGVFGSIGGFLGISAGATAGIGLGIAGVAILGSYLFGRSSQRKKDEKLRNQAMLDGLGGIQKLIDDVKTDKIDGSTAVAQAEEIRKKYVTEMSALKSDKTRRIALADVVRLDTKIAELKTAVGEQTGRRKRFEMFVPTFADGGSVRPRKESFRFNPLGFVKGPGTSRSDDVRAYFPKAGMFADISNREYVLDAETTANVGISRLDYLRATKGKVLRGLANGGAVMNNTVTANPQNSNNGTASGANYTIELNAEIGLGSETFIKLVEGFLKTPEGQKIVLQNLRTNAKQQNTGDGYANDVAEIVLKKLGKK